MFNWFRRKKDASKQSDDADESKIAPSPEAPPSDSAADTSSADPEEAPAKASSSTDYLGWAKAAFQNLQRQKSTPAEVPTDDVSEELDLAEEADLEVESEDTQPEIAAVDAATTEEPEVVDESSEVDDHPEAELEIAEPETPEAEFEVTPAAIAPATPEAEPVQAENLTETSPDSPTIDFDEGFLWSAQVLAEQGRQPEDIAEEEISWLQKLRQGLGKTRRGVVNQLKAVVGQGPLDQDAVDDIEALLLQADVGIEATDYIIETLQARLREETLPPEEAIAYLKSILRDVLERPFQDQEQTFAPEKGTLNIWLMTGVNGAGKTTTIGKIAHLAQKSGYRCLIAAADTFRAAAVEQVKVWGDRSGTTVIANPGQNTDPAAIVFDGIAAAESRHTELLLVDTAGRLQNKKNLMDELAKIRRIIDKKAPHAKVESLLVLDATLGQNGLRQAEVFAQSAKLSGVVLTKLDGSAKGGVALAVAQQLNLPIRFIGAGEGIEDLRPFSSYEFVEALLAN